MKVLLMGNPNVGKSVIFSKLTGTKVISSNYAGTTVEYTKGYMKINNKLVEITDVPGTYSLQPTNKAEEVAVEMLNKGDLIINVIDATNLERNLNLTLQLLEKKIPMIVVLNLWDEAQHIGIKINLDKLKKYLGVPIIPTIATKGNGIKEIIQLFDYREISEPRFKKMDDADYRWSVIGKIAEDVQKITHRHHTLMDIFEKITVIPITGIPISVILLFLSFLIIRFIGEGLIGHVFEPLFEFVYRPIINELSLLLGSKGIIHDILVGQLIEGSIDFGQSFGLLTTGIYIPFAAVLPYIIAFYFVLGILEDTGYLPRLSVLVDNIMHKIGLHGFSIIPMVLGFGCNVPAALAIRNLESKREKFIASTLMAICIPCMSQMAMILGLLGEFGLNYIIYVFITLGFVWISVGTLLNKLIPGFSTDLLLEIPSFRIPSIITILKKLWIRIKSFLKEAIPLMLLGILLVNILYIIGVFEFLGEAVGPFLNVLFGVPEEAIAALLMGFLRKDLAMGILVPLNLAPKQLVVISTVLVVYFPCIATFSILIKELGIIKMFKSTTIMLITTLLVGGFLNLTFKNGHYSLLSWIIVLAVLIIINLIPKIDNNIKSDNNIKL
jgi:ferrous iron transport protein B